MKVFCEYLGLGLIASSGSMIVIAGIFSEASFGWLALAPLGIAALLPQD
jgi:hypothetical protein